MALTRSFSNVFELTDYTPEILLVPNQWGLVNDLGLFREEGVTQHTINVESHEGTLAVLTDTIRGSRTQVNKDETRVLRSFAIPFFSLDDYISPEDIQGKRAYGSPDAASTEQEVMSRKIDRIARNHFVTMEKARCTAITTGSIFAPNGTVVGNYYTDFGVTRKEIDFDWGNTTAEKILKAEEFIAHIQDNMLTGEVIDNITVLCSPEFFSKLTTHPTIKAAYQFYSSTQEPFRNRLGSGLYREFIWSNVRWVEYRGVYNGQRLIPAGDAYAMPTGTQDVFVSYFSPANRFDSVNTVGERMYMWSYRDEANQKIVLQSESSQLHVLRRPQVVCRLFSST